MLWPSVASSPRPRIRSRVLRRAMPRPVSTTPSQATCHSGRSRPASLRPALSTLSSGASYRNRAWPAPRLTQACGEQIKSLVHELREWRLALSISPVGKGNAHRGHRDCAEQARIDIDLNVKSEARRDTPRDCCLEIGKCGKLAGQQLRGVVPDELHPSNPVGPSLRRALDRGCEPGSHRVQALQGCLRRRIGRAHV